MSSFVALFTKHTHPTDQTTPEYLSNLIFKGVQEKDFATVEIALQKGANPNGRPDGNNTLLHMACKTGNLDIVKALLDAGADKNALNSNYQQTPLHQACISGHALVVEELIKRHVDINLRSQNGNSTAVEDAIVFQHLECVRHLVEAGVKLDEVNSKGMPPFSTTPLSQACSQGLVDIVRLLLENKDNKANPNFQGFFAPICVAVEYPEILQLLVDNGANVDAKNGSGDEINAGQYPLHLAVSFGNWESVEILLKAKADRNVKNSKGLTALELATTELENNNKRQDLHQLAKDTRESNLKKIIGLLKEPVQKDPL